MSYRAAPVGTSDNCSCIIVYFHENMGCGEAGDKPESPQRGRSPMLPSEIQKMGSAGRREEAAAVESVERKRWERIQAKYAPIKAEQAKAFEPERLRREED